MNDNRPNIATREAYGKALLKFAPKYPDLVVLDADLSGSTKTKAFSKEYPERFFNMGIAEQNMLSTAAGLAHAGKIPFASSFAMFAVGRAWEQLRNSIAHNHLPVIVAASHAGITLGEDGASHQIIEDIALSTVIPHMTVCVPADSIETEAMIEALIQAKKPAYIRLGRQAVPAVHNEDTYKFEIGKANILQNGTDITLIGYGIMVAECLKASAILQDKHNMSVEVINLGCIKPLDKQTVLTSLSKTQCCIVAEEHNIIGGVNQQIASIIATELDNQCKFGVIAINDRFGQSGKPNELLEEYNLTANDIVQKALDISE